MESINAGSIRLCDKEPEKTAARGQKYYNQNTWSSVHKPGDHILDRNLSERGGPGNIQAYWENKVHVVKDRRGENSPVM